LLGKIYRPTKLTTLHTKRGFRFQHKYKSNFVGLHEFKKDVYLHYDQAHETIHIEVTDLTIPVVLDKDVFQIESADEARTIAPKRKVESLREIERPAKEQMSSSGDRLIIQMPIKSERNANENELLTIEMKPVVIDNQEYMWITATAETQVYIVVNTTVKLVER
jgi:hypothetical protein